ncbi:hypothetical protein [Bacillus safensis]|uniref:hypothetical protein n=1 Tax=Bacillus safensis TaxID=561879 RepID=UPI00192B2B37|nr:hypothetical protein [Bacillus safensis]MBL4986855.1 hypothetical protein [Bacillus safensis]
MMIEYLAETAVLPHVPLIPFTLNIYSISGTMRFLSTSSARAAAFMVVRTFRSMAAARLAALLIVGSVLAAV